MTEPARSPEVRKSDTLKLLADEVDAWVSTASADGSPYLMPLSFLWDGESLWLSTAAKNPTSLNLQATGLLHLAIGRTRDVVLITGTAKQATPSPETADAFATKAGFDPRASNYPFFQITPTRIQTWREVNEIKDRDLLRDSRWLV
ncbi:MAG TPA: pyridoxamine 5'-phosphate oxidase family protein [Kribbella sp.]|uniref:pyridoxamine 5'-phosphate oxidase family protein n=1 Tax=Kribbella sp. TaxID=1871183 RepID=UPI002D78ECA1|nr:pyridoxamine 5'-phosphate oxidase family protein [Kribbella sp.]HET6298419.1 pyridoxamine 5'-phosphate oxidase family protein [Kribbella sp.]